MPKKIWHELPCGVMYRFLEHRWEDVAPVALVHEKFPKEDIRKVTNPDTAGRKIKLTAERFNSSFMKKFWENAMNKMMEGHVIEIAEGITMYIGVTSKIGDGRQVRYRKNRVNYMHQKFVYGVVLNGFFHNYYFTMPFRRRKELFLRIKGGQQFIK